MTDCELKKYKKLSREHINAAYTQCTVLDYTYRNSLNSKVNLITKHKFLIVMPFKLKQPERCKFRTQFQLANWKALNSRHAQLNFGVAM